MNSVLLNAPYTCPTSWLGCEAYSSALLIVFQMSEFACVHIQADKQ